LVQKEDISSALEEVMRVPYLDCANVHLHRRRCAIPRAEAECCCVLPVELKGQRLTLIMADPQNLSMLDGLGFTSGTPIVPRQGFHAEILGAIAKYYKGPKTRDRRSLKAAWRPRSQKTKL
jgi:Type II secretion system (T2SS), protein E, N-terminal domain